MAHFLVTGATGAIGVPLVRHLMHRGHAVTVLVRPRPGIDKEIEALFRDDRGFSDVGILDGDVTKPLCGVSVPQVYIGRFDALIHAAGMTQYHESKREETFAANVGGTQHVADLAKLLKIERLVYISTAYVAGKAAYLGEDEKGNPELSHNPYEHSKIVAEEIVRGYPGRPLILRLGTVIGRADDGFIVNAGGYAAFVKGFWVMRRRILKFQGNPFYVPLNPHTTLNLVTSEWAVEHIAKATLSNLIGTVHLAHPYPVNMGRLFELTFDGVFRLPVTHDRRAFLLAPLWKHKLWRPTQEWVMGHTTYFGPYVTRDTTFAHERAPEIPGYQTMPVITDEVIRAQMSYMVNHLFPKEEERPLVAAE